MKTQTCERCGHRVFFENVVCGHCGAALGFDPVALKMGSFDVQADGTWQRVAEAGATPAPLRPCENYTTHQVCNWMVEADDPNPLCRSCRTTRVLPALDKPENVQYWLLIEQAKRRLFNSLMTLGLPVPNKVEDPANGMAFEFLEQLTPVQKVLTGHDNGVITLNIAEADDSKREHMRAHLHESYRTLLGHFRHEIGHYYWDRLVANGPWLEEFRTLFGDEREDYAQALQRHYANPRTDWAIDCISLYASSHPWEDWAECWAHYLHMQDGLETAASWGLTIENAVPGAPPVSAHELDPDNQQLGPTLVEMWLPISQFVNAMARSLGTRDGYPFVVPAPVIQKLEFVHKVVRAGVTGQAPMNFGTPADAPHAPDAEGGNVPTPTTDAPLAPPAPADAAASAAAPAPVQQADVTAPQQAPVAQPG